MKKAIPILLFILFGYIATAQVDQYTLRARLHLRTDSFFIWRGDTINFRDLVTLKQLLDSLEGLPMQDLSSTRNGTNVAVNISGGDGTSFSVADDDNSVTNELQNLSKTKTGNNVTVNISSGTGTVFSVADGDSIATNELNSSVSWTDATNTLAVTDPGGAKSVIITGFLESEVDGSTTNEIELPAQSGNNGKFLTTNGSAPSWAAALTTEADGSTTNELNSSVTWTDATNTLAVTDPGGAKSVIITGFLESEVDGSTTNEIELPTQSGNSGKFLTTNGSAPSWAAALTTEADGSTTNELNSSVTWTDANNTLAVTDPGGAKSVIIAGFLESEVDGSTTNEIQNLSKTKTGNNVTVNISSGTGTTFSVADGDSLSTNEIQSLSLRNDTLFLSGGGNVKLPSTGDNWGNQVAVTDNTLSGNGSSASPLKVDTSRIATHYDISGLGSRWTKDTYGINYQSGNVGIGYSSRTTSKLYVNQTDNIRYAGTFVGSGWGLNVYAGSGSTYNIMELYNSSGSLNAMNVASDGRLNLPQYTGTTMDGAITKYLGVNSAGKVYSTTGITPGGTSGNIQYNNSGSFAGFGNWSGTTMAITGAITATDNIYASGNMGVLYGLAMTNNGYVYFPSVTAPSAPSSTGMGFLYMNSADDRLYLKTKNNTYNLTAAHDALTLGTTNGLSLSSQQLSLGLAGSSSTGALSSSDWITFNNKLASEVDGSVTNEIELPSQSGNSGKFLTTNGTSPTWATPASGSSHDPITLGTANGLSLSTQQLSLGLASSSTSGALSTSDWNTFNGKMGNVLTATGDLIYSYSGSTPARLPIGNTGQILKSVNGSPMWMDYDVGFNVREGSLTASDGIMISVAQLSSSKPAYIGMVGIEITTSSDAHYGYVFMIISGAYNGGSGQVNITKIVDNPGANVSVTATYYYGYVMPTIQNNSSSTIKYRLINLPGF